MVELEKRVDGEYCLECGWERQAATRYSKSNPPGFPKPKPIDKSIFGIDYLPMCFKHKGVQYRYNDIQRLDFEANDIRFRRFTFFLSYAQNAQLSVLFLGGKKLLIRSSTKSTKRPEGVSPEQNFLNRTYLRLARESTPFRIKKYLEEFKRDGSFLWNGVRWFPDEFEKGRMRYQYKNCELILANDRLLIRASGFNTRRKHTVIVRFHEEREMAEAILKTLLKIEAAGS
jgi:hypothetical protein